MQLRLKVTPFQCAFNVICTVVTALAHCRSSLFLLPFSRTGGNIKSKTDMRARSSRANGTKLCETICDRDASDARICPLFLVVVSISRVNKHFIVIYVYACIMYARVHTYGRMYTRRMYDRYIVGMRHTCVAKMAAYSAIKQDLRRLSTLRSPVV